MAKKLISLLLVAIMLFSLSAVAFADAGENESNVKQYEHYCSLGDSVAQAIYYDNMPDTFPRIVGRAVGCTDESLWENHAGMRLMDMAAALHVIPFAFDGYADASGWGWTLRNMEQKAASNYYEGIIEKADLITIQLGINDVMYSPFSQFDSEAVLSPDTTLEEKTAEIEKFIAGVVEGTASLKENYPKLLDRIAELKQGQDYDVVMVGIFNTNNMMDLSEDIPIPVGSAVTTFILAANAIIKQIAEDYGYAYVDITNVPTGAMINGVTVLGTAELSEAENARMTHPAYPEGYQYIARQIINQLPVEEPKVDTNIRVDLGPITEVTSVTVGSTTLPESMWSFNSETHMLTVKHLGTASGVLTVTSKGDNKTIGLSVYHIYFDKGTGYVAHLLYQNYNLTKTAAVIFRGLGLVTSTVVTSIMNLFKK